MTNHVHFGDIPVWCGTLGGALDVLVRNCKGPLAERTAFRLVNAYSLAIAQTNPSYGGLLASSGYNFPDGKPLALALRGLRGEGDVEQIRGPSLFVACLDKGRAVGLRHFFLGGTPETLQALVETVGQRFPGATICGAFAPPFGIDVESYVGQQDAIIRDTHPDIVWVALGTPRQDFEAQRLCDSLLVTTVAVGAAFDFLAGTKAEAPPLVRAVGLEWLFRLATEPRRLWKRYLFGNLRFLMVIFREWKLRRRGR